MPKGIMLTLEQQSQRREEITEAALQLFDKIGFQKTSMREIAQAVKMGKSSLYDFFKTKDEIVVYAVEQGIMAAARAAKKIAAEESSPEECLRKIMYQHLRFTKNNKSILLWLNTEDIYLDEEYQTRLQTVRQMYRNEVGSVIEDGIAAGIFRKTDTALAARLLVNSMLSIAYVSHSSSVLLEDMLDETIRIFLHGVMN